MMPRTDREKDKRRRRFFIDQRYAIHDSTHGPDDLVICTQCYAMTSALYLEVHLRAAHPGIELPADP